MQFCVYPFHGGDRPQLDMQRNKQLVDFINYKIDITPCHTYDATQRPNYTGQLAVAVPRTRILRNSFLFFARRLFKASASCDSKHNLPTAPSRSPLVRLPVSCKTSSGSGCTLLRTASAVDCSVFKYAVQTGASYARNTSVCKTSVYEWKLGYASWYAVQMTDFADQ